MFISILLKKTIKRVVVCLSYKHQIKKRLIYLSIEFMNVLFKKYTLVKV